MAYSVPRRRSAPAGRPIVIHVTVPAARPVRRSKASPARRIVVRMPTPVRAPRRRYY